MPERLAKLRKRLTEYEAIASIRLREADKLDANGQLPISVEVTEREPRYLGFGANYSTTDGSLVNAYWATATYSEVARRCGSNTLTSFPRSP